VVLLSHRQLFLAIDHAGTTIWSRIEINVKCTLTVHCLNISCWFLRDCRPATTLFRAFAFVRRATNSICWGLPFIDDLHLPKKFLSCRVFTHTIHPTKQISVMMAPGS
jgi:hypothetical protein